MQQSYNQYYNDYLDRLTKRVKEQVQTQVQTVLKEVRRRTYIEFFTLLKSKVENMYRDAIDEFYEDYDPLYYRRRNSLYDLIDITLGKDSLTIEFDPSKITYRDGTGGNENGLYDLVFRQGYHGGSTKDTKGTHPNPGVPYWRTPYLLYSYWGQRAAKAPISPLLNFKLKLYKYQKSELQKDFDELWKKNVSNIEITL